MSDQDDLERGGSCAECGEPVEEDHHAYCPDCFAAEQGWKRPARPEPGTPPPSFVVGLAELRETVETNYVTSTVREAKLQVALERLEQRVEALERQLAREAT